MRRRANHIPTPGAVTGGERDLITVIERGTQIPTLVFALLPHRLMNRQVTSVIYCSQLVRMKLSVHVQLDDVDKWTRLS